MLCVCAASFPSIPARGAATLVVTYTLCNVPSQTRAEGQVSYAGGAPVPFGVDLPIIDLLRPAGVYAMRCLLRLTHIAYGWFLAAMTTPIFGQHWTSPSMQAEVTTTVPNTSIRT